MGDFGRVGTASLWKSGPLFSTVTSEAESTIEGLRLNLRSLCCDAGWLRLARKQDEGWKRFGPKLSTAFAELRGLPSPGI